MALGNFVNKLSEDDCYVEWHLYYNSHLSLITHLLLAKLHHHTDSDAS